MSQVTVYTTDRQGRQLPTLILQHQPGIGITAYGTDQSLAQFILQRPIDGPTRQLTPDDGIEFLRYLAPAYTGQRLRASSLQPVDDSMQEALATLRTAHLPEANPGPYVRDDQGRFSSGGVVSKTHKDPWDMSLSELKREAKKADNRQFNVPDGYVLGYHRTANNDSLTSILENGLLMTEAQGKEYNEPGAIWAYNEERLAKDRNPYVIFMVRETDTHRPNDVSFTTERSVPPENILYGVKAYNVVARGLRSDIRYLSDFSKLSDDMLEFHHKLFKEAANRSIQEANPGPYVRNERGQFASGSGSGVPASDIEHVPDIQSIQYDEPKDDFYYHITTEPNLPNVLENGLKPSRSVKQAMGQGFYRDYSKGKLFFSDRDAVAFWRDRIEEHLDASYDDPPPVALVRFPKTSVSGEIKPDTLGQRDSYKDSWFLEANMGPYVRDEFGRFAPDTGGGTGGGGGREIPRIDPAKYYKPVMVGEERDEQGRSIHQYEGPFESAEHAMFHELVLTSGNDVYDLPPAGDHRHDYLIHKATKKLLTAKRGKYVLEDAEGFETRVYIVTPPRAVRKDRKDFYEQEVKERFTGDVQEANLGPYTRDEFGRFAPDTGSGGSGGGGGSYSQSMQGEYWIQGGQAVGADGDVGDFNHEGYAIMAAQSHVASSLGDIDGEFEDYEGGTDWDAFRTAVFEQHPEFDDDTTSEPFLAYLEENGLTTVDWDVADNGPYDPRLWTAAHEGWIRLAGNDAQMVGVSNKKLSELADGVYDAYGEEVENESFNIEVVDPESAKPGQTIRTMMYDEVPFAVIEGGKVKDLYPYRRHGFQESVPVLPLNLYPLDDPAASDSR